MYHGVYFGGAIGRIEFGMAYSRTSPLGKRTSGILRGRCGKHKYPKKSKKSKPKEKIHHLASSSRAGDTIEDARNSVYELVKRIGFEAKVFDRTIGDWELNRLSITKAMTSKESEAPIKKSGTQDNSDASGSHQSEALASSTGCGGSVSNRSSSTRSFDDGDSNVGGVGAGAPGEGGCSAAEGNIGTLAPKSARPYPPQTSFVQLCKLIETMEKNGKEHMAVMKARGTKLRCWIRLRCRVRFPSARLSQLGCWRFVPPRWRGQLVALYAAYRVFHSLSR